MLLAVPLAPLIGGIIASIFGTKLGGNLVGRRISHSVTILGVLISFVISSIVLYRVAMQGAHFDGPVYTWMVVGGVKMEIGFLIDGLSAMMMCVVSFVSLMVHIYTIGYMADDDGYDRFFGYIALFTFSMLMLAMSNNMLQLFFGWEAVGLVSYLLIGFWYTKPSAVHANLKAFMVNRVGDFGFILGIALALAYTGTLDYSELFAKADTLAKLNLPGTDWMLITVICICLFVGAMGKSAQVPLHVWLPDSMEGPTPISALIHAATMVTAGIFMVARMSPLFELSDTALSFVLVIGGITALFMGIVGIVQNDIKRVVAYSTLSQLGYMTVALGASAYSAAVFHLMTHAFFKALLFLGAGSVILSMHHNQDIRWMGGLRKYMPITWLTFLVGTLALVATPFFSGFYSKDSIIEAVHESHLAGAGFAWYCVMAGVFVTAFYSFRVYFLVFHGEERYDQNPDAHHGDHHDGHHSDKPREQPWVVTVPLILLAIPSAVIGYITIEPMLFGSLFKGAIVVDAARHPAMAELAHAFHGPLEMGLHSFTTAPFWIAVAGFACAYYMYMVNRRVPEAIRRATEPLYTILVNKYYFDWFNENVLVRGLRAIGTGLWKGSDLGLIDGLVVNGSWKVVRSMSGVLRWAQSGYLYHYALAMIVGMFILMTYFVWLK
ncbi:MAG: NADH-ubiquinone oxidoreductase chain L [Burkholderiaceae bacterium]|nr:MAG: NADH-ubiquinone oxidoreductase chain L [Burkholderiaceae bacterium]